MAGGLIFLSEYVFLFDLDATITRTEILPEIAIKIDKQQQMRELTEKTMTGEIPFDHSFWRGLSCFQRFR